jgi:hypothetical protein
MRGTCEAEELCASEEELCPMELVFSILRRFEINIYSSKPQQLM